MGTSTGEKSMKTALLPLPHFSSSMYSIALEKGKKERKGLM
jgi:hypothetical protein